MLTGEEERLVSSVRKELRIWPYVRWVWLAAVLGIFYYWTTLFNSLRTEDMVIREVHYWRQAVILAGAALGGWLFKNWNLPKERLIARLADHAGSNRHDTN